MPRELLFFPPARGRRSYALKTHQHLHPAFAFAAIKAPAVDVATASADPRSSAAACRLGLHSTMRAAALLPGARPLGTGRCSGPMTPAQLSQYATSPIRYGHPPETVACPLG